MAADDLKEVLSRFVPAKDLDEAIEAVKTTEVAPEWYRNDIAKVGAEAKEGREAKAELEAIKSEPTRIEAYKRVGLLPPEATDASGLKPYQKDWLNQNVPADKLADLEFVASKVNEGGFEVSFQPQQQTQDQSGAEQITDALTGMGAGAPVTTGKAAADQAFYADLDKVPDGDKQAMTEVLAKHGRLPATEG